MGPMGQLDNGTGTNRGQMGPNGRDSHGPGFGLLVRTSDSPGRLQNCAGTLSTRMICLMPASLLMRHPRQHHSLVRVPRVHEPSFSWPVARFAGRANNRHRPFSEPQERRGAGVFSCGVPHSDAADVPLFWRHARSPFLRSTVQDPKDGLAHAWRQKRALYTEYAWPCICSTPWR